MLVSLDAFECGCVLVGLSLCVWLGVLVDVGVPRYVLVCVGVCDCV